MSRSSTNEKQEEETMSGRSGDVTVSIVDTDQGRHFVELKINDEDGSSIVLRSTLLDTDEQANHVARNIQAAIRLLFSSLAYDVQVTTDELTPQENMG
jgi:hypothetical protein